MGRGQGELGCKGALEWLLESGVLAGGGRHRWLNGWIELLNWDWSGGIWCEIQGRPLLPPRGSLLFYIPPYCTSEC